MSCHPLQRRELVALLAGAAVSLSSAARGQQAKVARIGALVLTSADAQTLGNALREGLRPLGYVEGQNFVLEIRSADGDAGRLPALASELVRAPVDVIVAAYTPCALAAKQATSTIPIVMAAVADPIASGLVQSLARPGGNVTGFSNQAPETAAKNVELFRDMLPSVRRVGVLANPSDPFMAPLLEQVRRAGQSAGIEIAPIAMARVADEVEPALAIIAQAGADAAVVQGVFFAKTVADLAIKYRLPTASVLRAFPHAGGLMSYGADVPDMFRRSAVVVQKILQGARPADLPVELPTKFELVVNMRTAKAIGLSVAESFLARADEVIE
jgi:putative ABC transport system substrate-binding protein